MPQRGCNEGSGWRIRGKESRHRGTAANRARLTLITASAIVAAATAMRLDRRGVLSAYRAASLKTRARRLCNKHTGTVCAIATIGAILAVGVAAARRGLHARLIATHNGRLLW